MRIVAGLQFFNHIETDLLYSQPLMRLIGFNGRVIKKGNNQSGVHRIKNCDKEQAITNLGKYAKITSIAIDRGLMDGKFLHWLDSQDITFYIPAKHNQDVYQDALSLVKTGQYEIRTKSKFTGYGKNRREFIDTWEVVGIEGLTTAGFYSELGSSSHQNRKDFKPDPINAVLVLHDPYTDNNPNCQTLIILTNGPVNDPLPVYDGYDARSKIENYLFRESKQAWFIKRPPQKTVFLKQNDINKISK